MPVLSVLSLLYWKESSANRNKVPKHPSLPLTQSPCSISKPHHLPSLSPNTAFQFSPLQLQHLPHFTTEDHLLQHLPLFFHPNSHLILIITPTPPTIDPNTV